MRYLLMLFLSLSFVINSEESDFKEGDKFEAKKFDTISLYFYKADATRLNLARDLSYSLKDFVDYAALDYRDIYKIRKGETFVLTQSYKNGDIFEVNLESKRTSREKYFVLAEDLKKSSLILLSEET